MVIPWSTSAIFSSSTNVSNCHYPYFNPKLLRSLSFNKRLFVTRFRVAWWLYVELLCGTMYFTHPWLSSWRLNLQYRIMRRLEGMIKGPVPISCCGKRWEYRKVVGWILHYPLEILVCDQPAFSTLSTEIHILSQDLDISSFMLIGIISFPMSCRRFFFRIVLTVICDSHEY